MSARWLVVAVLVVSNVADANPKPRKQPPCSRLIAKNVAFKDLKVVGEVRLGTRHKVLLLDNQGRGHIVRAGECVGREHVLFDQIPTPHYTPPQPPPPPIAPGTLAQH